MKSVKQEMSREIITIDQDEAIAAAYAGMTKNSIRHLPVTNATGHIVGILSDRDVYRAMRTETSGQGILRTETFQFNPADRVKDYMTWPALTISSESDIRQCANRMLNEKVSSLLVMKEKRIVGIITTEDLVRLLVDVLNDEDEREFLPLEEYAQTYSNLAWS